MLKFLRKYQLLVLVVGGSLLMVVFLLQPVLTKMAPSPAKRKAAEIGLTGTKITQLEMSSASRDVEALKRLLPPLLGANAIGIALTPVESDQPDHWLLLSREAEAGGFVGGPRDGLDWIPEIGRTLAAQDAFTEMQQRRFRSEQEFLARQAQLEQEYVEALTRNASLVARSAGMTDDEMGTALARARGIRRMLNSYARAAKPSRPQAVAQARDALDAVQFDFVRVPANLFMEDVEEPTDAQLQEFFDRYREDEPTDNDYGFSYVLAPRVKIAYLELDAPSIAASLVADRIELNKRWRADRETYPGEFNQEIGNVDAAWRVERVQGIMYEADQIIRAEVRRSLRPYAQGDGEHLIPEGTNPVDYEKLAETVVEEMRERSGIAVPLPTVRVITDRWRTGNDLRFEPDIGRALYRVGPRQYSTAALPEIFAIPEPDRPFEVQPGVPLVENAATDAQGSRFYVTVLAHRDRSAAEDIDEVGRDRVVSDYRTLRAYEGLLERRDEVLRAARETGGVRSVVDLLDPVQEPEDGSEPAPQRLRAVTAARAVRDQLANTFDAAMNTPEVREAILTAADRLDPLADSRDHAPEDTIMVLELPRSKSLAAIKVVAPRPLTTDDFRAMGLRTITTETDRWLSEDESFLDDFPYTYDSLVKKYDYQVVVRADDEDGAPAEEEPEPEASAEG